MTPASVFDHFLASLGARPARDARSRLGALWGVPLPVPLARFLDALAAADDLARGSFHAFAHTDWLPPADDDPIAFMLAEWFRRIALLTGTIPIGCTGDGDIWLAEVDPRTTRVGLLDHDEMALAVVADSIEAFALLIDLEDAGAAADWTPLAGRVRGTRDLELPAGLPQLAGTSDLEQRAADVDELLGCLWYAHEPKARTPTDRAAGAPALIERILRAFLRCDDTALAAALEPARAHPAELVRATAALVGRHVGVTDRATRHRLLVPSP